MNVKISRLSNGLVIATDPMLQLESASLGVWVGAGTRNETAPVMGISHMLEHMAFKGTKTRSARAIAEEIEAVGGFLNAYTSREQTAFHARVLKEDVTLALDLIADILINPAYALEDIEKEKQVVLQEIGQVKDTPDDIIFDHLQTVCYPDQPLGFPVLGLEATVAGFRRDDLMAFMGANYLPGAMVLVASGAVDHDAVVRLAEEKFGHLKPGVPAEPVPARYVGGEFHEAEDLEQAHIAIAVPGVSSVDPDWYLSQVYTTALGGGMSSRLFQEAREKRGLCYSIYAFAHSSTDDGVVGVYTGTGADEAGEIAAVIVGEMASLAETASEEEVARAKAQLKSSLLMGLERPSSRAELIASHLFNYDRVLSVAEMMERLAAVDAAAVRRFGEKVMRATAPAVATVGPAGKLEQYGLLASRFGSTGARAAE